MNAHELMRELIKRDGSHSGSFLYAIYTVCNCLDDKFHDLQLADGRKVAQSDTITVQDFVRECRDAAMLFASKWPRQPEE